MAPRKKTTNAKSKKNPKMPKLEAFLLDFDDEGKLILTPLVPHVPQHEDIHNKISF